MIPKHLTETERDWLYDTAGWVLGMTGMSFAGAVALELHRFVVATILYLFVLLLMSQTRYLPHLGSVDQNGAQLTLEVARVIGAVYYAGLLFLTWSAAVNLMSQKHLWLFMPLLIGAFVSGMLAKSWEVVTCKT